MEVMFVLLPIALLFSAAAVAVFLWASATGQFDDLETPGLRMLHDDDEEPRGAAPAPTSDRSATATSITPSR